MRSAPLSNCHRVVAEFQEGLPAISWKRYPAHHYRDRLRPVVLVGLAQFDVEDSSTFDRGACTRPSAAESSTTRARSSMTGRGN